MRNANQKPEISVIGRNQEKSTEEVGTCLSIMQPYVFPYIGYFQLIEASTEIVFYDDVNYIKRGWVNRNRILLNNQGFLFTIPVEKASQNKKINEIVPAIDDKFRRKLFLQLESAYSKAPFYNEVTNLSINTFERDYQNIGDMGIQSVLAVFEYLGKTVQWRKSSVSFPQNAGIDKADRLIDITKQLGYKKYINPIGGKEIYQKEYFKNQGVDLYFLKSGNIKYRQSSKEFVPYLSIIDVLMYNDKHTVLNFLKEYDFL